MAWSVGDLDQFFIPHIDHLIRRESEEQKAEWRAQFRAGVEGQNQAQLLRRIKRRRRLTLYGVLTLSLVGGILWQNSQVRGYGLGWLNALWPWGARSNANANNGNDKNAKAN